MNKILLLLFLVSGLKGLSESNRRLAKLDSQSWNQHTLLGANEGSYAESSNFPDLSMVGALQSVNRLLGTGTLIAPNLVVSAAHIFKNSYEEDYPDPDDWEFILAPDFQSATESQKFKVTKIIVHPGWLARQSSTNPLGDGDSIGVDLCLVQLDQNITGVFPIALPDGSTESIGQRIILAGFGNLFEGKTGLVQASNSKRLGGENTLDRVVEKFEVSNLAEGFWGGLLAFDFDSPLGTHNYLGSDYAPIDNLGTGDSNSVPLAMEASTATGDSGGPALLWDGINWRVHGVVSYGTNGSFYGDVTVFTRLGSHADWIHNYLPSWAEAKFHPNTIWRESDWLGFFINYESGWNFHSQFGWFFCSYQKGGTVWIWQNGIGWWWTSRETFPFLFDSNKQNWFYMDSKASTSKALVLYDYSLKKWFSTATSL